VVVGNYTGLSTSLFKGVREEEKEIWIEIKLKPLKKVKIEKAMFDTFNWTSGILKQLFFVLTQSQKLLSAYTAHTLTRRKWHVSNSSVKKN
jgi:hypothetical protein